MYIGGYPLDYSHVIAVIKEKYGDAEAKAIFREAYQRTVEEEKKKAEAMAEMQFMMARKMEYQNRVPWYLRG